MLTAFDGFIPSFAALERKNEVDKKKCNHLEKFP